MLMNRKQLALSLCTLVQHDYELINDIILEYVEMIDDTTFNRLEDYVNNEMRSIV